MQQIIKVSAAKNSPPLYRRMYVQLSFFGALSLMVAILLFTAYSVKAQTEFTLESSSSQAQSLAMTIANAASNYMVTEDFSVVEELLLQSAVFRDVESIQVSDKHGLVIAFIAMNDDKVPEARFNISRLELPEKKQAFLVEEAQRIISWQPIENGSIGWVRLVFSLEEILAVQERIWRDGVIAGVVAFILSLITLLLFLKRPIRAIENATNFAKQLYKSNGKTIPVERSSYEVEQLEYALNYAATQLYAANKNLSDMKFALDEHAIVGITDSSGRITYVNDRFCAISQYTKGELLGNNFTLLRSGMHGPDLYEDIMRTVKAGNVWHGELSEKRKDGSLYWVDTTIIPFVGDDGVPYQFITIQTDITERKEAEKKLKAYKEHLEEMVDERTNELQLANKELESFCYSVSHDLRAPLRSIDGFSQALIEDYADKLDEGARDFLERVRNSSQRMGELIDDLLNLSRVVRADMNQTVVDMTAVAEEIVQQLLETDTSRRVDFNISPGMTAEGDERLIKTMLENLLGNAWKFTSKTAKPVIEFGACDTQKGKTFYVRDNGAGFDQAYAHKLFEPFQRLHSSQEFEGSGIGLATVNRIVKRHGGEVWAEGEAEKGATIYFTLT